METTSTDAHTDGGAPDLGALAVELRLACMRISRRVRFESADDQLPPHQFSVLARLDAGVSTPGDLAAVERVSAPSMTRTVAALTQAGLVDRQPHPSDGRQVLLTLTPRGRRLLRDVRARRDLWMSVRLAELDAADVHLLAQAAPLLARVAAQ